MEFPNPPGTEAMVAHYRPQVERFTSHIYQRLHPQADQYAALKPLEILPSDHGYTLRVNRGRSEYAELGAAALGMVAGHTSLGKVTALGELEFPRMTDLVNALQASACQKG